MALLLKPLDRSRRRLHRWLAVVLIALLALANGRDACAYSVLTHEEIVDLLWKDELKPLLQKKFPGVTAGQLNEAHSYAYGGSLVQDIGYYPFGNKDFSDLVHYVRSGDFVVSLLDEAQDADAYAFALGALSHYAADVTGHPLVNIAVATEFPNLKKKYGDRVTYAQNPKAHLRTEFGFDVVQVARQRYTPDAYHEFIGFQVSKPLLERAFRKTYGLELKDLFLNLDLSIGTFRRAASKTIPEMTRAALITRQTELKKEYPNFNKQKFLYNLSRTDYERWWGKTYQNPSLGARLLSALVSFLPKIGPFRALAYKVPTKDAEDLYFKSINETVELYRTYLLQLSAGKLTLQNKDCDTGKKTVAGEYTLTDETYAMLVGKLAKNNFATTSPDLRQNLLHFFDGVAKADRLAKDRRKGDLKDWQKALEHVEKLRAAPEVGV